MCYGMARVMMSAGATSKYVFAEEPELLEAFAKQFPDVPAADSLQRILEDDSIQFIVSAAIPSRRAVLAIQAMQHGKDVLLDKPGLRRSSRSRCCAKSPNRRSDDASCSMASGLKAAPPRRHIRWRRPVRSAKSLTLLASDHTPSTGRPGQRGSLSEVNTAASSPISPATSATLS